MSRLIGWVVVAVLLLAGCATSSEPSRTRSGGAGAAGPQSRCLVDPNETSMRPLVFLFCIQTP